MIVLDAAFSRRRRADKMPHMPKSLGWYLPEQMILKITLAGSEPEIWRRVEVHSGLTLYELHHVIQCLFDWDNSHLYHFLAPAEGKLTQKALREATRYHTMPPDPFFDDDEDSPAHRADEAILGQVLNATRKRIIYEYDFGDSWEHIVKVEKRTPGGDQDFMPVCLAGENAAPPEDCGGIGRYYHWLEAYQDKSHPNHDAAMDVLGKNFDPARFDPDAANRRLKATFKPIPEKPRKPRKPRKPKQP